jgi:hypothetical protein
MTPLQKLRDIRRQIEQAGAESGQTYAEYLSQAQRKYSGRLVRRAPKPRLEMHTATPLDGQALYVGFNAGEFGGNLLRVDLATGAVHDLASGPVTGVIPDPVAQQCVLVSVGLEHMIMSYGRILHVSGDQAAVKFEKPAAVTVEPIHLTIDAIFG